MSVLRYFNKVKVSEVFVFVTNEKKEKTVKSMDLTRNEVWNVKSQSEKTESLGSGNRKPYMKWTPGQRAEIGERTHKHDISSGLKHFAYPNLKKQTVFEFRKAYKN